MRTCHRHPQALGADWMTVLQACCIYLPMGPFPLPMLLHAHHITWPWPHYVFKGLMFTLCT